MSEKRATFSQYVLEQRTGHGRWNRENVCITSFNQVSCIHFMLSMMLVFIARMIDLRCSFSTVFYDNTCKQV